MSVTAPPHPITTIPTQPNLPPQPTIPITPLVYRPRNRSPHDSHSEHSHHDERTRPHSSRSDDPSDRYPPRRQYSRDRAYPSYYDRQYSPPREHISTHQPRPRPSRFDHSTLPTSHRRHRDNSPPSRNVRSTSSCYTELHSPPTASNTIPVVPSLSLPSSTSPPQPTNPPIPPSQSTHTTSSISPTQATPLPPMTAHPVTGSTAVRPELPSTYVQEVTWPTPRGRFHDLPPSNPLDHSLYLYADPQNIRTQLPQETLNLIHVVPHADLSTLERYYPNYAADPTHFLSLCCSIASCIGYLLVSRALLLYLYCTVSTLLLCPMFCSTAQWTVYLHRQELSVINGQFCS